MVILKVIKNCSSLSCVIYRNDKTIIATIAIISIGISLKGKSSRIKRGTLLLDENTVNVALYTFSVYSGMHISFILLLIEIS